MEGSGDQWLHLVALLAGSCLSLAEGGEVARLRGGGGGTGPGTAGGHLDITQYSTVQYSTVQYSTVLYSTVQYSTVQLSWLVCSLIGLQTYVL